LAENLETPLLSFCETEWRERGYGLNMCLEAKLGIPFVSLRSENNFVEAKQKLEAKKSEKKRKNITELFK
jgi:hypothetical protein